MPIMVAQQPTTAPGGSFGLPSRVSNNSRTDDSGSGAEGPARKRQQKAPVESNLSYRRPTNAVTASKVGVDRRTSLTARRRSVREQKAPLGPRPPDFVPTKSDNLRYPTHANALDDGSSSMINSLPGQSTHVDTSVPRPPDSQENRLGTADPNAGAFDFIPSVSFDELHSSITSNDYGLDSFPAPAGGAGVDVNSNTGRLPRKIDGHADHTRLARQTSESNGTRFERSGSLLRQHKDSDQTSGPTKDPKTADPQSASLSLRSRRQSHYHPTNTPAMPRAPRKSIGPGVIDTDFSVRAAQRRRPSMAANEPRALESESRGRAAVPSNPVQPATTGGATREIKPLSTSRSIKAKSLQPPPRTANESLSPPSTTPDGHRSTSLNMIRSPGKSPAWRANTPSSSSKRLSVMPIHATGLGARTISPTDARRIKRMSMLPDPPPMPTTPQTPQQDPFTAPRSLAQSPSIIPRKSVTPSSSRTTPEPNRKSYSSGVSTSSNTTYNSARTSTGSLQPRLSQNLSITRLPAPKPCNLHGPTGEEEDVPPVPAIPKAYESPKEPVDLRASAMRKSSLPLDLSSAASSSSAENALAAFEWNVAPRSGREPRDTRGLTVGSNSDAEGAGNGHPGMSRKNSKLVRLPPLNVLPLSTPTVAKVAALREPSVTTVEGKITPTQKKGPAKTPSTPMTASKATFFPKNQRADDNGASSYTRSNSSTQMKRSDSNSTRPPSTSAFGLPGNESTLSGRQIVTPHVPSSIPRSSGEHNDLRRKYSSEQCLSGLGTEPRIMRLNGPRAQTSDKVARDDILNQNGSASELDTPTSGMSLRRKLSQTFKRSSSKASQRSFDQESDHPPHPPKHDNMPPPKLPASATMNAARAPNTNSPTKSSWHLESRRRKSSAASLISGHERTRSDSWSTGNSTRVSSKEVLPVVEATNLPVTAAKTASSILSPMHKILGSKSSLHSLKAKQGEHSLDRDDMAAEDEMKKLASKRKDFEVAAKEVDELRRRATAKDRVTPAQTLRAVQLNIFERGEIVDYKDIYFCGAQSAKKHIGDLNAQNGNFGYDDERGDYNIVGGDHLAYRYEIIDVLGKGSFGQVVRCVDHKTGGLVAVKIIRNKKRFHQQALVEVNILQKLREWDPNSKHGMVSFTQSFYFRGHLCISTELLGMNLYEFIKSNDFRGFSLKLIRRFTKQLLNSLVLLKSHSVIHCDLKPENVLLAHPIHSEIKVIDFGSSCFEDEKVYTYIQSRFYRSPEVILGMSYGMPIDIWSLGCILAELFTGYPIFPGENEQEQLACIMEVFGPPEKHLIEKSTRKKLFFDSMGKPRLTVSSKGKRRRPSSKSLQQVLKCEDEAFLDFITRCLRWDPERRLKPDEALRHEFIMGTKLITRSRARQTGLESSVKRVSTAQTHATSRPLPEPPVTSLKVGATAKSREVPTSSPSKGSVVKRHSTINGIQPAIGVKRSSTGAAIGSNLPRVAPRSASTKSELATAAAAAATISRR
ncbi:MAG: hypothetical protein M1833_000745 [Piccolia ochrophora]|nr:MAG: hypothetical protein M1833_000745 [Piccolia ochrophora]